jgi:hypothetical protein
MLHLNRKFVAVLLAVWLPLFSGYALAESIVMQSMHGDCHDMQQVSHPSQHVSASHQHMHHTQLATGEDQSAGSHHNQNSTCNNCGLCQLACSGYFAVAVIHMALIEPSAQTFTIFSTQFQSVTSPPLDPPPLARV